MKCSFAKRIRQFMKLWYISCATTLILCNPMSAQTLTLMETIRIEKLAQKFEESLDISYLWQAQSRCAGIYMVMWKMLSQSDSNKETADVYLNSATRLNEGALLSLRMRRLSGDLQEINLVEMDSYMSKVIAHINLNYERTGDRFVDDNSDPLSNDLSACKRVANMEFKLEDAEISPPGH